MISKAIYSILSSDAELASMGVDISPLWTDTVKKVPMMTYAVDDDPQFTKTESVGYTSEMAFMIASDSYLEMNTIGFRLIDLMDKYSGTIEGCDIRSIDLMRAEEERDKTTGLYFKSIIFTSVWNR